ncbi:GFA family protein [Pseudoalteromonas rubra]|uniref:GFA family protein n=1 Tax=Pseudoalteromonas rubra TaxID=43658 RepID=UPI002DBCAC00|nr:GFA family protein [Pseudoalteromonas rubra]MEC4089604.1 GFA family protein [Pseudoalteromonas rubra]
MKNEYHGSCLCGHVTFSVSGFSTKVANCHCTMCRKFHGAAFGTLVSVTDLNWLSGTECLKEFTAPNGTTRTFCHTCGSSLGFRSKGVSPEDIEIAISTFDTDIPVKVDAQIFTSSKANWCSLQADIPTFKNARTSSRM